MRRSRLQAMQDDEHPTGLSPTIAVYLTLKKTLGRRFRVETDVLSHLDKFLVGQPSEDGPLSSATFTAWSLTLAHLAPTVRRNRTRIVRNLCLYQRRSDPSCFMPDPRSFPALDTPLHPHIFTTEQMMRLLGVAPRRNLGRIRCCVRGRSASPLCCFIRPGCDAVILYVLCSATWTAMRDRVIASDRGPRSSAKQNAAKGADTRKPCSRAVLSRTSCCFVCRYLAPRLVATTITTSMRQMGRLPWTRTLEPGSSTSKPTGHASARPSSPRNRYRQARISFQRHSIGSGPRSCGCRFSAGPIKTCGNGDVRLRRRLVAE